MTNTRLTKPNRMSGPQVAENVKGELVSFGLTKRSTRKITAPFAGTWP